MDKEKIDFIVVDDSKLDCFIAEKIVQNTGRSASVATFLHATEALSHIANADAKERITIVFVDIQMPVMNGFDFVAAFEQLDEAKKKGYIIYMLSSSINESDLTKVKSYPSVRQFLNKPLTGKVIATLLEDYPAA